MSRGVRDLREIVCVSRLGYAESSDENESNDDDEDGASELINHDHYTKFNHKLNDRRCSSDSIENFITDASKHLQESSKRIGNEKLSGRDNFIAKGNSTISLQRPSSALRSSSDLSKYGRSVFVTLAAGKSNSKFCPRSQLQNTSSANSTKSSGVDIRPYSARNYDDLLIRVNSCVLSSWLEATNIRVREMDRWCRTDENFVCLAHIWLSEVTDRQKSKLINRVYRYLVDSLSVVFSSEQSSDCIVTEFALHTSNTSKTSITPSGENQETTFLDRFNSGSHISQKELNSDNTNSNSSRADYKGGSKSMALIIDKTINSSSSNSQSGINVDNRKKKSKNNSTPLSPIAANKDINGSRKIAYGSNCTNGSSSKLDCNSNSNKAADNSFNSCSSGMDSCSSSRTTSSSSCSSRRRAEASTTESGYSDNIIFDYKLNDNDFDDENSDETIQVNLKPGNEPRRPLRIEINEVGIMNNHQSEQQQQQHNTTTTSSNSALVAFLGAIFREYPTRMLGIKGSNLFLDYLDVLTSDKSSRYRMLLSDVKCWTDEPSHAQSILAIRSVALVTVWSDIVSVVRQRLDRESAIDSGRLRGMKEEVEDVNKGLRDEDQTEMNARRMYQAIRLDYVDVVRYLLTSGKVSPKLVDSQNKSLVFHAVISNSPSTLHFLISEVAQGVDVNILARNGNTALHAAANVGSSRLVTELLRAKDLCVDAPNVLCNSATPLHVAVMQGHIEVVRLLLEAGADRTLKMGDSMAIDLARDFQYSEILDLLHNS